MAAILDEEKIKNITRQVEFYFSDSNLPRDKFLRSTVEQSEDGLVSLGLICSFARMRKYLDLGEVDQKDVPEETVLAVAEALRKSSFLKVSDDGKKIGRSTELLKPEEVIEQVDSRTVAASPFPYDIKIEDVQALFGEKGKVNSVRLPRHVGNKRAFCGTALIEFSDEDDAKKVLQEKLVYAGADLELKPKNDFDSEREKNRGEGDKTYTFKDSSKESYTKGLIVAFELKPMATDASGVEVKEAEPLKNEDLSEKTDSVESKEIEGNKDSPVEEGNNRHANSVNKAAVVTREDLKEVFQKFGVVKYIDFRMGEESGYIRFEEADAAVKARAKSVLAEEGGLLVKKKYIVNLEALTGDAERDYWALLRGNIEKKYKENKSCRGRGKYNRGGRHSDGKRPREEGNSANMERSNKAQKAAE